MKIGERIRYVRNSKNITQSTLANSIHISPSFMNRIEDGSSEPYIYHLRDRGCFTSSSSGTALRYLCISRRYLRS